MTLAPPMLMEARAIMIDELNMDPGPKPEDLEPNEVGIVADENHIGGYHCGSDRVRRDANGTITDYSVIESMRDRTGLSIYAAGIDVGWFQHVINGKTHNMHTFNAWLVGECQRGAADTRDIREVIYTLDGVTVKRWDRLGRRTTGDKSHLGHTHMSEFRDARGRNMPRLFRRYLDAIGLGDMNQDDKLEPEYNTGSTTRTVGNVLADVENLRNWIVSLPGTSTLGTPPPGSVGAILLEAANKVVGAQPPALIDPLVVYDAIKVALSDATVLAGLAKAINDDHARRMME